MRWIKGIVILLALLAGAMLLMSAGDELDTGPGGGSGGLNATIGLNHSDDGTILSVKTDSTKSTRCAFAQQIDFHFRATAGKCSLVVLEVTNDTTKTWLGASTTPTLANVKMTISNTVTGASLATNPLVAVAHVTTGFYSYIPFKYARLKITTASLDTLVGLSVVALPIYATEGLSNASMILYGAGENPVP